MESKTEKRNSQCESRQPMKQTRDLEACFACADQVRLAVNPLIVTNEFHVRSILHGQASSVAVNNIYVFHEVMNSCKILNIY